VAGVSAGLESIAPVVLVGGRSVRLGRDKLLEPWGARGDPLVSVPVGALREVFGCRVCMVGACDARVARCGDRVLDDGSPGLGPIGGILTALESLGDVLVLAGDMPRVDASLVRLLAARAGVCPEAEAVVAESGGLHPCAAVYRAVMAERLRAAIGRGERSLVRALAGARMETVAVSRGLVTNLNTARDFEEAGRQPDGP